MSTRSVDAVTQGLVSLLENQSTVNLKKVYYGEEDLHPSTPSASVTVSRESELQGANYRMIHSFTGTIVVYHSRLGGNELARKEANQQAEALEEVLHKATLGGILVDSWVTAITPGYSARDEKVIMKSTAIDWVGRSRTVG